MSSCLIERGKSCARRERRSTRSSASIWNTLSVTTIWKLILNSSLELPARESLTRTGIGTGRRSMKNGSDDPASDRGRECLTRLHRYQHSRLYRRPERSGEAIRSQETCGGSSPPAHRGGVNPSAARVLCFIDW